MSEWTSLGWAQLLVAGLTPVAVVAIGWWVARATKRLEHAQWSNRTLIERRLVLHDELAPGLNDLYCFFMCRGHFREITPRDAVSIKRDLDKTFYVNRFLFSESVFTAYERWSEVCFQHDARVAHDAPLRASAERQRVERGESWDPAWSDCFVTDSGDVTELPQIADAYTELMRALADDVGVTSVS